MDDALNQLRGELAGRYEVEQELGHGGMAVVYLAKDLRHDRRVAIKVLRQDVGGASAERFLREIRTVAQLHHPHILQLLHSGTAGDHLFYVMPYVEGETIRQRLEREGPLPIDEAVRIAREVADALAFAHARGIVHRDIKPENIFLSAGHALVADFGIARAAESAAGPTTTLTDAGLAVGTPAYMSPEQATAEPRVDGRSDQYALGCVLYEMLSGAPPFTGPTSQAIMARHTADPVPPLRTVRDVPVALESAIHKALGKMPADRWPNAETFATALSRSVTYDAPRTTVALLSVQRPGWVAFSVGAGVLALVAALSFRTLTGRNSNEASAGDSTSSLIVRPFGHTGDSASRIYSEGLAEGLLPGLMRIPGMRGLRLADVADSVEDDVALGRKLGVQAVLSGEVQIRNGIIRVTPRLTDVIDGEILWTATFNGEYGDDFSFQDSINVQVVSALQPHLDPTLRAFAARGVRTKDSLAYALFLEAKRALREATRQSTGRAVTLLEQAVERDSLYADAYALLADALALHDTWRGTLPAEQSVAGRRASDRAVELDPLNGFARTQRGWWKAQYDWEWDAARRDMREALKLAPASSDVAANYGLFMSFLSEPESAIVHLRRAVDIDPTHPALVAGLGARYMLYGKTDSAVAVSQRAIALDSTNLTAFTVLMLSYLNEGRASEAARAAQRVLDLDGEAPSALFLANYYRRAADTAGARELMRRLLRRPKTQYLPPTTLAATHLALGNRVAALAELERATSERDLELPPGLLFWFAPLENEPRFQALWRQVFKGRPFRPSAIP